MVAALPALGGRNWLRLDSLEPLEDVVVIELLRPEQPRAGLSRDDALVGAELRRQSRLVEFVSFLAALRDDLIEVAERRRVRLRTEADFDGRCAAGGNLE